MNIHRSTWIILTGVGEGQFSAARRRKKNDLKSVLASYVASVAS